jgi:hypothetical protein
MDNGIILQSLRGLLAGRGFNELLELSGQVEEIVDDRVMSCDGRVAIEPSTSGAHHSGGKSSPYQGAGARQEAELSPDEGHLKGKFHAAPKLLELLDESDHLRPGGAPFSTAKVGFDAYQAHRVLTESLFCLGDGFEQISHESSSL